MDRFFALDLGVMFWATAGLFEVLLNWRRAFSIIVIALIVGLYTFFGGLAADTDTPFPWTGILFGLTFVMANAYMIGNQAITQRCLAAKNEWHAKASMVWGAFLKMFIPILVLVPGLIAIVIHPGLEDGDEAMPKLIHTLLPPGLRGLLLAAFLAGLMSSIDSMLNSTATLWTKDIYEKYIRKDASDHHYLVVGRCATVVLLVLGVATSPISQYFEGIYVAVQTFLSMFQGPVFSILLLGIFWRRTTQWGGLAGMLITIIVSLVTKPHSTDHLQGLVFALPEAKIPKR